MLVFQVHQGISSCLCHGSALASGYHVTRYRDMTDLSVIVFSKADVNRRYSKCYYDLGMNGGGGR